jgi:hypothetical protein
MIAEHASPAGKAAPSEAAPPSSPGVLRQLHRDTRGATATEYLLILALVVLPIGLLSPLFLHMIKLYGNRILIPISLPFP